MASPPLFLTMPHVQYIVLSSVVRNATTKQTCTGGDDACTNNAGDDDRNHMCLWWGVSSPVHCCGLLEDKWVLIKQIPPTTPQGAVQQSCSLYWATWGVDWLPTESWSRQHVCGASALIGLPHHRSLYMAFHFNPFISQSSAAGGGSSGQQYIRAARGLLFILVLRCICVCVFYTNIVVWKTPVANIGTNMPCLSCKLL